MGIGIYIGLGKKANITKLAQASVKTLEANLETLQNLRDYLDSGVPGVGHTLVDKFHNEYIWTQADDDALNAEIAELTGLINELS